MVERHVRVRRGDDFLEQGGEYFIKELAAPRRLVDEGRPFPQQEQVPVCLSGVPEPEPPEERGRLLLGRFRIEQPAVVARGPAARSLFPGEREELVVDAPDLLRMPGMVTE